MIKDVFKYQSAIVSSPKGPDLQKIQACIRDGKSKYVYSNCLLYSITKDLYYIKNLILTTEEGKTFYQNLIGTKQTLLIFGAGERGKRLVDIFEDIPWTGFVDNNVYASEEYCGMPIVALDEAQRKWPNAMYIVSPLIGYAEIEKQLEEAGIPSQNILTIERYNESLEKKIYIDSQYIPYSEIRRFADCGGYNGDDTKKFLDLNENNKVYLFEPDPEMYESCRKRFQENTVMLYNKGLHGKRANALLNIRGGGMSSVTEDGSKVIVLDTLDNTIDQGIDFLKMDIEGCEYDALDGAEKLILRDRPKVAISVYHKEEDIWKLPLKLLQYDETYRFEFRHYSLGQVDTVMYVF